MRLWHYELVPVLPRQQLLGQWRELNAIYKLQTNHVLVNFVYEDEESLLWYSIKVIKECLNRGYRIRYGEFEYLYNIDVKTSIKNFKEDYVPFESIMNDRYLAQCFYNLQEKYDRGAITLEEYERIYRVVNIRLKVEK